MRTAFARVQGDLDPLLLEAKAAAADGAAAAGAPPRRYSDAERERARTGDRIVGTVLAGLPGGGGGLAGPSGGGGGGGPSGGSAAVTASGVSS
jgi:hypothetical protein